VNNIRKQGGSINLFYQEKIAGFHASVSNLEEQVKSLQAQIDSKRTSLAELVREREQKLEDLERQHFIHLSKPEVEALPLAEGEHWSGPRPLGKKGNDQFRDYLVPAIRLIKNGMKHTDAFHRVAKDLDVTYQTVNAQCTLRLGISTKRFVELTTSGEIKSFLRKKFPDRGSLIDREF
jgi:regulator of replication initiation timing